MKKIKSIEEIINDYDNFIIDQWGVMHDGTFGYDYAYNSINILNSNAKNNTTIDISNNLISNLKLRRSRELNLIRREDSRYTKKENSTFVRRESSIHLDIIKGLDEENLKIHKAVQDLIHEKMCLAVPPKELIALFLQYDEHVTVYQILRHMEIYDKFPVNYGTPYPEELMKKIDERINYLNKQYQKYNKINYLLYSFQYGLLIK